MKRLLLSMNIIALSICAGISFSAVLSGDFARGTFFLILMLANFHLANNISASIARDMFTKRLDREIEQASVEMRKLLKEVRDNE